MLMGAAADAAIPTAAANPGGDGGREIWVDGPGDVQPGNQGSAPDVAMNPDGQSIYVWASFTTMTDRNDIYLRVFDPAGTPQADPLQVNTLTLDDQLLPRVAVSSDGSFLVIWQSDEPDADAEPSGAIRRWVRSQAFNSDASPLGSEQLVNATGTNQTTDRHADVAALSSGGWVVVWDHEGPLGNDTNRNIQARLIGANGVPAGNPFVVNSAIGVSESDAAVTGLADGGLFVAWTTTGELFGRAFDANGTPEGNDVQLNTDTQGAEFDPDLVLGADGRVLLIWDDGEAAGDDNEIRARMFSSSLVPLGDDFRVNTLTENFQRFSRVGAYGSLGFLAVWVSDVSAGDDNDGRSIQGRMITGNNQFAGPQFQVNSYVAGGQAEPTVGGMGEAVSIAWWSPGNAAQPLDDVIVGEAWSVCGIFCDGFED
jgi:hypothetical protein